MGKKKNNKSSKNNKINKNNINANSKSNIANAANADSSSLPDDFVARMNELLGDEAKDFFDAYNNDNYLSLRINPLKNGSYVNHSADPSTSCSYVNRDTVLADADKAMQNAMCNEEVVTKLFGTATTFVKWEKLGRYYEAPDEPGRHPLHNAGLYYIQEASAMAPVHFLEVRPKDTVLDLCASPGGKTTQIAGYMNGSGLLVCNEPVAKRAKILSENIERMSVSNAIVTSEFPDRLAEQFGSFFDKILVDAPCSGEGMFRKHPEAISEWSPENVELCANRQAEIMKSADLMLKRGGRLVYSTCTFAKKEDEQLVQSFVSGHAGKYRLVSDRADEICESFGFVSNEKGCYRLFPHRLKGEGHFLAVMEKLSIDDTSIDDTSIDDTSIADTSIAETSLDVMRKDRDREASKICASESEGNPAIIEKEALYSVLLNAAAKACGRENAGLFAEFISDSLTISGMKRIADMIMQGRELIVFRDTLSLLPEGITANQFNIQTKGIKVLRAGLELGRFEKGRFEPAHALALYLSGDENSTDAKLCARLSEDEAQMYLKGLTIVNPQINSSSESDDGLKGWCLVSCMGYSLGWAKLSNNTLKNHYPKGLRVV